jgi:hypothetical protein
MPAVFFTGINYDPTGNIAGQNKSPGNRTD